MPDRSFTDLVASVASFLAGSIAVVGLGACGPDGAADLVGEPAAGPGAATDGALTGAPEAAAEAAGAAPGATPGWSAMAQESIAASEYAPVADGDGGERLQASNRKQDLRLHFGNGVAVTKRNGEGEVVFTLGAWGREDAMEQAETVSPEEGPCLRGGAVDAFGECLHRVDYARPGLTEWWENRPEGLEQGFDVTAAPEGDGALVFELEITGGTVEVDGDEAMIRRSSGDPLRYAGLVVTDATGRELPSWLEEMDGGVRIVVEDGGAIGVLRVDPLLTTAGWMAESDQAGANFGYSVASAGDVNGDGYGDVVVGARYYANGSAYEGRAFLYLGSAGGLSATAAWTAESDQASAQFGEAVASAGDVNGDGYGDVVVGAYAYDNGSTDEGRAYV